MGGSEEQDERDTESGYQHRKGGNTGKARPRARSDRALEDAEVRPRLRLDNKEGCQERVEQRRREREVYRRGRDKNCQRQDQPLRDQRPGSCTTPADVLEGSTLRRHRRNKDFTDS